MMSNKLIAEFMELPTEVSKAGLLNYYHREYNSGTWYEEHELSYNVSWDWLMPVLSKILDITFSDDETETSDSEYFYNIRDCVPDINHTYRAIVEFIKKYNQMEENRKKAQVHMIPKEAKNSWDCNRTKLLKLVHDVGEAIYKKDSVGFDLDRWIKENL